MVFPFHKIAEFARTRPVEISHALNEFFPSEDAFRMMTQDIEAYFTEWLIFEYKQSNNVTFLTEYVLKNPDLLHEKEIDQFKQIAESQRYSDFQIIDVIPGSHVIVEDIFTGKIINVHDKKGSENLNPHGSIKARVAHVDDIYYFVGANPSFIPMIYTPRMKKLLRKQNNSKLSVKDTAMMLLDREMKPPPKITIHTPAQRKAKQKEIRIKYQELVSCHPHIAAWEEVLNAIYTENEKHIPNFFKILKKVGIPENLFIENLDLFQDIWNFFPHKMLGDKSPDELIAKLKSES